MKTLLVILALCPLMMWGQVDWKAFNVDYVSPNHRAMIGSFKEDKWLKHGKSSIWVATVFELIPKAGVVDSVYIIETLAGFPSSSDELPEFMKRYRVAGFIPASYTGNGHHYFLWSAKTIEIDEGRGSRITLYTLDDVYAEEMERILSLKCKTKNEALKKAALLVKNKKYVKSFKY